MKYNKEQMREYQRNRRKALQNNVKPDCKADVKPEDLQAESVKPDVKCKAEDVNLCKAVKPECQNCKAEYERGYKAGLAEGKRMAAPEIVRPESIGDTIYEPDPVKPVKQPKVSVSKAVQPLVNAMLSSVKRSPTVQHHPTCGCAMCKPAKAA